MLGTRAATDRHLKVPFTRTRYATDMRWILFPMVSGVVGCNGQVDTIQSTTGTGGVFAQNGGAGGSASPAGSQYNGSGGTTMGYLNPVGGATSGTGGATAAPNCPTEVTNLTGSDAGTDGKTVAISSGLEHTCALLSDGIVKCWGDNSYGQLGVGVGCLYGSSVPVKVAGLGISDIIGPNSPGLCCSC